MECSICFLSLLDEVPESQMSGPQAKKRKTDRPQISDVCCTPCGHLFHRACLLSWFKQTPRPGAFRGGRQHNTSTRGSCPRCRSRTSADRLYPVFVEPDKDSSNSKPAECSLEECQNIRKCHEDLKTQLHDLQQQVKVEHERAQTSETKLKSLLAAQSGETGAKPRSTPAVKSTSSSSQRRKWPDDIKSEASINSSNSDDEDEFSSEESNFSDDDFDNYDVSF